MPASPHGDMCAHICAIMIALQQAKNMDASPEPALEPVTMSARQRDPTPAFQCDKCQHVSVTRVSVPAGQHVSIHDSVDRVSKWFNVDVTARTNVSAAA